MKHFICIGTDVVLSERVWRDAGFSFNKLLEVKLISGKWQSSLD